MFDLTSNTVESLIKIVALVPVRASFIIYYDDGEPATDGQELD